jgi:protein LTV1
MVFTEKANPNREKIKHRSELDEEFGVAVRDNEGEAANHGVYYDDSKYDYMQHLRDIGTGGEGYFVEAPKQKGKGKGRAKLEDALRDLDLQSEQGGMSSVASSNVSLAESLFPDEMLPSEFVQKRSYQDQQDTPDAIAGLQPDMDPSLREVLEALDDEAYVDDDEDIFEALVQDGEEVDESQWAVEHWEDGDDGWESDHTIKADQGEGDGDVKEELSKEAQEESGETGDGLNDDWMEEFNKFRKDAKSQSKVRFGATPSDAQLSIQTGATNISGLRRKKRKGALTASTGYSMTSSVLARTEGQSILDRRFDKLQEDYAEDDHDDDVSMMSGFSGLSKVSGLSKMSKASQGGTSVVRSDFDSIMDEFLGDYSEVGHRRVRKGRPQTGLEQLDEIRKTLGPARIGKQSS